MYPLHQRHIRDLQGQAIVCETYYQSSNDMSAAPRIPSGLDAVFEKWSGHGCKQLRGALASKVKSWFCGI